jgi:hypothetical protein
MAFRRTSDKPCHVAKICPIRIRDDRLGVSLLGFLIVTAGAIDSARLMCAPESVGSRAIAWPKAFSASSVRPWPKSKDPWVLCISATSALAIVECDVESAALSAEKVQISLPEGVLALGAPRAGRNAEPWGIEWSTSMATHRSISAGGFFEVHLAMPH